MAKKHLGQNFLFDNAILLRIIGAAGLSSDDTVVEIGPGPGRLTKLLAERVRNLIAIELDSQLYASLKRELGSFKNLDLVLGDALKFPFEKLGEFKVVANIPYYITTPIIFRLLEAGTNLKSMTLTIQKEVAERIVAHPGGKDYGVLSITTQIHTEPELKFIIPKEEFRPVPKVDSAVVHMKIRRDPPIPLNNKEIFLKIVRAAFSQRRKTLSNSLKSIHDIKDILKAAEIDAGRRPETLSIEEFGRISNIVADRSS